MREYAKQYVHYVEGKGGGEEFARWRAGVFLMYIAGVPASAVANMTQPLVLTVPALGQFVGATRAMAEVAKAAKDAAKMFSFKAGGPVPSRTGARRCASGAGTGVGQWRVRGAGDA